MQSVIRLADYPKWMPYLKLQVIAITTPPHLHCTLRAHVLYAGTTLFISSKTALRLHAENQSRQSEQGGLLTRALLARIEQDVAEACCLFWMARQRAPTAT